MAVSFARKFRHMRRVEDFFPFFFFIPMENLISSLSLIRSIEGRGWGDGKLLDEKIFSDGFSKSRRLMHLYLTLRYLGLIEFYYNYLNFLYEFYIVSKIIFHRSIKDYLWTNMIPSYDKFNPFF